MVAKSFLKTGIGMTIALATLASAVPASAQDWGNRGDRGRGQAERSQGPRAQADRGQANRGQAVRASRAEAQIPRGAVRTNQPSRPAPAQQAQARNYGRDWTNGGAVARPDQASRGHTPATPTRGSQTAQAGSTPQRGWDGQRWNGDGSRPNLPRQQGSRPDESRPSWSGGGTSGRDRDNDRNRGDSSRDKSWSHDRDRDGRWDNDRRDGHRWGSNDGWRNDGWRRDRDGHEWRRDRDGRDYRRWTNDWRRDNRYNWSSWRSRNHHVFRGGYYSAPYRGYSYSRLSIGLRLGSPFYAQQYWISDPWAYRLPPAYGPYRWVRYYDDVMLIDTYSGEVVDVIYDFFW